MDEEWQPIPGYEGRYSVSSLGRVRVEPRILAAATNVQSGYLQVSLAGLGAPSRGRGGLRRMRYVHSLVAEGFFGLRPPGLVVNHKDGNRLHNTVANLEYVTPKENTANARIRGTLTGAKRPRRGEAHHNTTLTADDVRAIRTSTRSHTTLATVYPVSAVTISNIRRGKTWAHVSDDRIFRGGR